MLEAEAPGFGASGRNHGQVVPALSRYGPDEIVSMFGADEGERFNRFVASSGQLVFDLIARQGIDCDAKPVGWLLPVDSPARENSIRARADAWARRGVPVRFMEQAETRALTGSDYWNGALFHPWGGNIQPLAFARGLAAAGIAAGAAIHGGSCAGSIERAGRRWRIGTPDGSVVAEKVIIATNGYTDDLWPDLKRTIVPFRLFLGATVPQGDNVRKSILPEGHSISDSRTILWSFRWDRDGRMVMGGDTVLPYRGRRRVAQSGQARLKLAFPEIADAAFEFVWDGKVAMTMDRLPRLFELGPGLWSAMGYNGRGIALAIAMGKHLASTCLNSVEVEGPLPAALQQTRFVPAHRLAVPLARAMLLHYRWKDARAARSRR